MSYENQELISLKLHKFPSFISIINSQRNRFVGGKLVGLCAWAQFCCKMGGQLGMKPT